MKLSLVQDEDIFSILNKHKIQRGTLKYVLIYGRKNGSDIDVFVVINSGQSYQQIIEGVYDISIVHIDYASHLLRNHDPFITEPIMTGECILGQTSIIKVFVLKREVSDNTIIYLLNRAQELIDCADYWSSVGDYVSALSSLIWANSYTCFAYAYFLDSGHVKLFKEIVRAPFARELVRLRHITKYQLPRNRELQVRLVIESKKMLFELLTVTRSLVFSRFDKAQNSLTQ